MIKELEYELKMREQVYSSKVQQKRMTKRTKDTKINKIRAVLTYLENKKKPTAPIPTLF